MNAIRTTLEHQYSLIRDAREVLFDFCARLPATDLVRSSSHTGNGGSIRNLFVHVRNTYVGWIAGAALRRPFEEKEYEWAGTLEQCREYFNEVNNLMEEFLQMFEDNYQQELQSVTNDGQRATPLRLFTHVITHEFHHKGQILALARQWGHIPVDTDVVR